ncbi:MAG: hypothetical protein IV100_26350 [Myxococcales bacterium]|nr:hypothetical protein [Myxococcales bacterium]
MANSVLMFIVLLLALVAACGAVDIVSLVDDIEATFSNNAQSATEFVELGGAVYMMARGPLGEELYRHTPAGGMVSIAHFPTVQLTMTCCVVAIIIVRSSCSTLIRAPSHRLRNV